MSNDEQARETGREDGLRARLAAVRRSVDELGGGSEGRRERLVRRADDRGLERADAEQAYDIAREEHLDPAFGMALVIEGVSVRFLDGPRSAVDSAVAGEPEWVDAPPEPDQAERERRLRQTFRRLRGHLESHATPDAALDAFAEEPDLEAFDY